MNASTAAVAAGIAPRHGHLRRREAILADAHASASATARRTSAIAVAPRRLLVRHEAMTGTHEICLDNDSLRRAPSPFPAAVL